MPQAQFTSPRFSGDTLLEDILNDPNPAAGSKKLDSQSPKPSVERGQQADQHVVLFDEGVEAISRKVSDLQAAGVNVQMPVSNALAERFRIVPAAMGVFHLATIQNVPGTIPFKRGVGAFEVHGAIFQAYREQGFANDTFGFPINDEQPDGPGFRRSEFENGSMRLDESTGIVDLLGPAATAPDTVLF
jgi:hypothetical protein